MRYQTFNSGVYAIYDLNKNCIYVGATSNFDNRYKQHVKMIYDRRHHNSELQKYCDKIGVENLVFTPIFYCHESEILFYEKKFIELLKPYANHKSINQLSFIDNSKYFDLYQKATEKFINQWVTAAELVDFLQENGRVVGDMCKKYQVKRIRIRQNNNRVSYFFQ